MPAYTQSADLTVLHEPFVRGLGEIRIAHPAGTFAITPASLISLEGIANNQHLLAGIGLDWGSGAGCLAIAAARIPAVERVIGLELSAANVVVARQNAAANGVERKTTFFESDSYSPISAADRRELESLAGQIDFLVANPPASDDGDGFGWRRRILAGARHYLTPSGRVFLSVSSQYGMRRVMGLLDDVSGFEYGGILASTEWVPFDLARPDLLECLRLYAQEESRGGLSYDFHDPAASGEQARTATSALERYEQFGESPLMKWQTHLFESFDRPASQLTFRLVTTSDIGQLAEWNHQLIRDEGHRNRMTVPELADRMRGWLEQDYRAIVFDLAGTPVAYALFREQPAEIYLRQLFVVYERRRQGIGKRAIELLRTKVWPTNKRLTVEVLTANTAAVAFWRSVGYRDYSLMMEIMPEMAAQTFRPLRVDELRAAYDVYLQAFYALQDKSIRQWPRPMPLEVYEQRQLRGENFGYFVGDALAVIVSLARQESAEWREETGGQTHWWLKTLATAAEFHGRRLGEQMVAACEMWLRERGEKKLLLDCADAGFLPHFYTRLGFHVVARKSISYPSGDTSAMVLMEKFLP